MCGIAGFCGKTARKEKGDILASMLDAQAHRGPDGRGTWLDPNSHCALGHVRLAVIDLEAGHQPMTNETETIWISFNGCIYNYQALARELRAKGHRFKTHSDTEVIVHAYEEWGAECVCRFNGMWAFALWNADTQTLFCSRDRIGIKPFYYTWDGDTFAFASEIKALLAGGHVDAKADSVGLRQYLTFQFCLNQTTLFHGVNKLPPGYNLILRPGAQPQLSQYWDINFQIDETHSEEYFVDQLQFLLEDAVRLRLRADVPLGAHLSGGLDSSAIVCLARTILGQAPVKTFTGAFAEGEAFDETPYAKITAQAAGTQYLETYLRPEQFTASIEDIIWHMDEPAAGPGIFPQYWVSKLAGQHVKVVLGGQGGDEIFIGYARYLVAYLEECLKGAIEQTADRAEYVATLETIIPSLPALEKYIPMLKSFWREGIFDIPAKRYFRLMDRFSGSQALLHNDFRAQLNAEDTFNEFNQIFNGHGAAAMINRIFCFDSKTHLQSLLHVEDRTSMAWGLESRVPLLDHRIIELMTSVPPVTKFRHGRMKHIFKQAIRNVVPQPILKRKDKMGFPVPLSKWFAGPLGSFARDVLLSKKCRERNIFNPAAIENLLTSARPFDRSLWGALCLELWYRRFIDTIHTKGSPL